MPFFPASQQDQADTPSPFQKAFDIADALREKITPQSNASVKMQGPMEIPTPIGKPGTPTRVLSTAANSVVNRVSGQPPLLGRAGMFGIGLGLGAGLGSLAVGATRLLHR